MNKNSTKKEISHSKKQEPFRLSPEVIFGFQSMHNVTATDMKTLKNIEKRREA